MLTLERRRGRIRSWGGGGSTTSLVALRPCHAKTPSIVVLFAFGLKTTLHDVNDPLRIVPALGLVGGIALYLLAHVALRLRIDGGLGRGRPVATVLLLGLVPVARVVPALTALGLVAAVCAALIGYEAILSSGARLAPQPSRLVLHGRGVPCRRKPAEGTAVLGTSPRPGVRRADSGWQQAAAFGETSNRFLCVTHFQASIDGVLADLGPLGISAGSSQPR